MNRRARRHIANRQYTDAQGLQHTQVCPQVSLPTMLCDLSGLDDCVHQPSWMAKERDVQCSLMLAAQTKLNYEQAVVVGGAP